MNQVCACRSVRGILLLAALCDLFSATPTHATEDALRATPPPGKALVFLFRSDREPSAAQVPVIVNTVLVGELANGTFITATVGPGRNYLQIGDRVPSTLVVEANQSYFVRVRTLGDPPSARTELNLVSEAEGRRLLAESRLAGVAPAVTAPRPPTPPAPMTAAPPPEQPSYAASLAEVQPTTGRVISTPAESGGDWDFALIAKAGTFKMADGNQMIAGLANTYDTTSDSVFGVEAEWRSKDGIALGGEVFHYKNDLVSSGPIPESEQKVLAIMANAKYYVRLANSLYPFVGVGIGQANASYSGRLTGKTTGLAWQGLVGMEFRFSQIGVNVQYRYLDSTTGATGNEVKVGGSGILGGVSIVF